MHQDGDALQGQLAGGAGVVRVAMGADDPGKLLD